MEDKLGIAIHAQLFWLCLVWKQTRHFPPLKTDHLAPFLFPLHNKTLWRYICNLKIVAEGCFWSFVASWRAWPDFCFTSSDQISSKETTPYHGRYLLAPYLPLFYRQGGCLFFSYVCLGIAASEQKFWFLIPLSYHLSLSENSQNIDWITYDHLFMSSSHSSFFLKPYSTCLSTLLHFLSVPLSNLGCISSRLLFHSSILSASPVQVILLNTTALQLQCQGPLWPPNARINFATSVSKTIWYVF